LSNSFSAGATVTWKERGTKDIDYSFDYFWNYCDLNGYSLSVTFDRDINALEALELAGIHAGIYAMHSRGKERIAGVIPRWTETLTDLTTSYILAGSVNIDSMEVFNSFTAKFGYDYINKEYTEIYTYPETDAGNASYIKHGYKREKVLYLPGYYSETVVKSLLTNLYNVFSDGLKLVSFTLDLRGVLLLIGERYDLTLSYPLINSEIELYGYALNLLSNYSIEIKAVDRAHLTSEESAFLLMPDGVAITMPNGQKIRRVGTW
jgi:hypothetical protein